MSELLNLTRTLTIDGYQFITVVHVDEVATDDESVPGVRIEQTWNPEHADAPDADDPALYEADVVHLTWAEWAELCDHVQTARNYMPEPAEVP